MLSFQSTLCDQSRQIALGMESGSIPDSALSASSSYNEQSVGPQNARLNRELNGGAWCPASQIDGSNSGHEWIQINFTEPYLITMISTQGRFGNGLGVEYAEYFWLEYTRDGYKWSRWRDQFGEDDIKGNSDTYSIVQTVLSVPLIGVIGVRLLPISSYIRTCCLRFELHGCPYQDGLVSYSMMDGQLNGKFGDLIDRTYDGYRSETGYLSNGLGQLTDGIKVFSAAMIWFSLDGRQWSSKPEEFEYMPDLIMEHARDVIIHLHNRIGRFVRFDFRFASTWLLISEANFDSFPLSNHVVSINELDFVDSVPITTTSIQGAYDTFYGEQAFVFSFVAICGLFLILFALFVFVWFNRKRKEKLTGSEYTTVPLKDVSPTTHYCEPNDLQNGIFMGLPFRRSFLPNQNGLSSPFVSSHSGLDNDPEYAVPDLIGNNILQSSNKKSSPKYFISSEKPTINQLIPSYQKSSIIFNKNRSNNGWSITKNPNHNINELNDGNKNSDTSQENTFNNDVANTEDHDDDGKARYYASSDVFLRQNQSDPRSLPPTNDFVNISNRIGALNYLDKRKNNLMSIAPLITESNTLMNFSTPQSSFSSPLLASSTATKPFKPSTNGSYDSSLTPNSSTSTNQNVSSMISLKDSLTSKIPLLNENDVSIINGHFGYSALGDCELGYLHQRNKERKIVVLETVIGNDKNLRDEFMLKMNEKWRLSNQCSEKFAQIFGYISKYDYLAMLVEYGDDDLKNFLRSTSQLVIRFVFNMSV
ncbi:Discoidin domain receptor-like protein [Sarcoptes scabiei]|uniref:Discoidin domain receptor-like protein n=1 Tax=Sarcoptes scabiei TaxID=52283 RepID=A0A132AFW8_SARSC|nr:Discoidin domain receptor-like protein [Sarcoptes scabiei]